MEEAREEVEDFLCTVFRAEYPNAVQTRNAAIKYLEWLDDARSGNFYLLRARLAVSHNFFRLSQQQHQRKKHGTKVVASLLHMCIAPQEETPTALDWQRFYYMHKNIRKMLRMPMERRTNAFPDLHLGVIEPEDKLGFREKSVRTLPSDWDNHLFPADVIADALLASAPATRTTTMTPTSVIARSTMSLPQQ